MYPSRTIAVSERNKLRHWDADEGTHFVTFRLFDSLTDFLLRTRRVRWIEKALDLGQGAAWLKRPDIGSMVFAALQHFHGERYLLHSACVMPNHVHVVFRVRPDVRARDVVRQWKAFTAREANRLLGRTGAFWQADSYDRLIRDQKEFDAANAYVLANPENAGLKGWPWVARYETEFVVKYETGDRERARDARTTPE